MIYMYLELLDHEVFKREGKNEFVLLKSEMATSNSKVHTNIKIIQSPYNLNVSLFS